MDHLSRLNAEQLTAATADIGIPCTLFAGAGTGKTSTLIARIRHMMSIGVAPGNELLESLFPIEYIFCKWQWHGCRARQRSQSSLRNIPRSCIPSDTAWFPLWCYEIRRRHCFLLNPLSLVMSSMELSSHHFFSHSFFSIQYFQFRCSSTE